MKKKKPASAKLRGAMTVKAAANYLGLNPMTVYRMCSMEQIPFFRLTTKGSIRLWKRDVDEWISTKTVTMVRRYI